MEQKTLILMRHAKSSWKDGSLPDFRRPLNKRGKMNAPMMGKRLKKAGYCVDCLISSSALRAHDTAVAVAKAMGYEGMIDFDETLYMADTEDFLHVIARVDETANHVMIISHNPGIEEFFHFLTGKRIQKFPTAAYAVIEIEEPWSRLSRGRLLHFDYPKA